MASKSNRSSILPDMRSIDAVVEEANVKIGEAISGVRESYITRWGKLNDAIDSIQEGEIIVIGGRPGSGKSAFANLIVQDIFDQHLNPYSSIGLYFSLEMPAYQQVVRWYSNMHQIESKAILSSRNPIDQTVYDELRRTGNDLKNMPLFFHDIPLSSEAIANTTTDVVNKYPDRRVFLIIDHSRLVTGNDDERLRIEKLVSYANTLKNSSGVITLLLSQMGRDIEKERDRSKMGKSLPVMGDLFAASAMEQLATTVMLLHRPEAYGVKGLFMGQDTKNLLVVNIAKQRNGWIGAVMLKSNFQYYDIHDGNTVVMGNDGQIIVSFVE